MRIAKSEARKRFAEIITRAGHKGERVKVTHYGKTLAVIVPTDDLTKLEDCEQERQAAAPTSAGARPRTR